MSDDVAAVFFFFCHPAIFFAVASSCLAVVDSTRIIRTVCLHPYTHESLDRTLLTSNDAERKKNDAKKGDNIYNTGRKLLSHNADAICCGVSACLWCYIRRVHSYVDVCRQDRILDLWDSFLIIQTFWVCSP